MIKTHKLILVVAAAFIPSACASIPSQAEREQSFLGMTLEHFRDTTVVKDDPLNPAITINTHDGYLDYPYAYSPKNDQFLRAIKVRQSGAIVLQGYVNSVLYDVWLKPISVTFSHTLATRKVNRIDFDVRCSYGTCIHYEDMVFEFSPDELNAVIAAMEEGGERVLNFRIKGQSGRDRDGRFHINELKAFQEAVKRTMLSDPS